MTRIALPASSISELRDRDPLEQAVVGFLLRLRNPNTYREYQRDLRYFLAWCTDQKLAPLSVRRVELTAYLRTLELQGLAEATISRKFGTVCCWLRYCADEELIDKDPTRGIERPTVDREKQRRTHLNVVEWAQLLRAARDHGPTAHALVALLGMKGLRVSEACQLDIETHLFTKDGYDQIRFIGKGNKGSVVTLPPPVARAVREITDVRSEGPLLLNAWGRRLDRTSANRLLHTVAREGAVLAEFSPHSLRRTMITLALGQGIPLYEVQLLARHANSKTTAIYDMNRRNVDRLSGASVASFMSSIAG